MGLRSQKAISALHERRHTDYDEARRQIHKAIGEVGEVELFGRQVLVAIYIRPQRTNKGFWTTTTLQEDDIYQGQIVLCLAHGPDAFRGDEGYVKATFGDRAPMPGDWLILRPNAGELISLCGDRAEQPMGEDNFGKMIALYDFKGWPCKIVADEMFLGRIKQPHVLV